LQLAAAIRNGDSLVESSKSSAIVVTVNASAAGTSGAIRMAEIAARSPLTAAAENTGANSSPPSAASCGLTPWTESSVLAWSTRGELAVADITTQSSQALVWQNDAAAESWTLQSVTTRRDIAGSVLYVVFTSGDQSTPAVHLVRYREMNGVLGERSVLLESALAAQPSRASSGFGPDGLLYVSFAWPAPLAAPAPFVLAIDPNGLHPDTAGGFDPRFQSRGAMATVWGADGRFWMIEGTGGRFAVRAADTVQPSWQLTASEPPIGLEALGNAGASRLAVFAGSGPGWLLSAWQPGAVVRADFAGSEPRQATLLVAGTPVSCHATPRLTLTYGAWRG
jgi:hypothetical protein